MRCASLVRCLVVGFLWFTAAAAYAQQPTPDQLASQLLDAGRRAYNERNLPFAADRFRQYLQQYGGNKDAHHARLGLGLALIESPPPQYQPAIEQLRPAADAADFSERALAAFYLGTAYRALGHASLVQAAQKPNEAATHRNQANQQFEQALKAFETAATAFAARAAEATATDDNLPADYPWAVRSKLDLVEMQLRLGKQKEAAAHLEKLSADPLLKRTRYKPLTAYYTGYAQYEAGEWLAAAKTLSQLAPFDDPAFGTHARYMLGRAHHLLNDHVAAAGHYEAILKSYDDQLSLAKQVAANGELLKGEPAERARLLLLGQTPPPEYVARSWFYAGVLAYEQEKFADALDRFTKFAERFKLSPLLAEASFRKGMSQVRLKMHQEAVASLTPVQDDPQLGDQARWWLGRAYVGLAAANPAAMQGNLNNATAQLKTAADRAGARVAQDPPAKLRRQDILLELGDAYQQNKQFNEAIQTFQQVLGEAPEAERGELALQRLATALHLAAKFPESDAACEKFVKTYPTSTLLPAILFRQVENALAQAEIAFKTPNLPDRDAALAKAYTEVASRAKKLIEAAPEFVEINFARHALGLAQYRLGQFAEAATTLEQIAAPDRSGELATTSYLLADCILRLMPETADDALAAGELLEKGGQVVQLLDGFIAANPQSPSLPDALVKLGDARLRIASVIENEPERNQELQLARQAFEKITQQFAQHPSAAIAVYERARCLMAQKDPNGAMNEYRRFLGDPLRQTPVAPMAILRLATMLRIEKRPQEAVDPLNQTRQQHEAALLKDPERASWAPLLQYHQALCLKEANKLPDAQALFENLVQRFPTSPEGLNAAWRVQQCRRELVLAKFEPARIALLRPDLPPNEAQTAKAAVADAVAQLTAIATTLQQQAAALQPKNAGTEPHLATLHEAAWCYRALAQQEIDAAREKLRDEALKQRQEALNKATPAGRTPPKASAPLITLDKIPLQPAEQKARELYTALIEQGGEARHVPIAKLQLAETLVLREEFEKASSLLQDALGGDVPEELADQLHVRLAACLLAQADGDSAYGEVEAIAKNEKHPLHAEGRFLAGESLIAQKKFAPAVELLKGFRDLGPLQNVPGVSDRAMLRLGYAYEQLQQFEPARQAYETLWGRYAQSPWRVEARYASGWCHQKLQQWDAAVNLYTEVTRLSAGAPAAQAQFNMGVCRAKQQRWQEAADAYQLCAFTYDDPDLCSQALVEGAAALEALKKVAEARRLLEIVGASYAQSKAATVAAERLQKLPPVQ
jgi:tetratricopeptide (TPR) repeat protein